MGCLRWPRVLGSTRGKPARPIPMKKSGTAPCIHSLELRAAALVATAADGSVDGLAEGASAGDVVSGLLIALPLEVGEPDEEDGREDGNELGGTKAVVGLLHGQRRQRGAGSQDGGRSALGQLDRARVSLRRGHEGEAGQLPDRRRGGQSEDDARGGALACHPEEWRVEHTG